MPTMSRTRESLLAQIQAGVLDDGVPLASLLQKCIILGGQADSEKMRDWARQELNGYEAEPVPSYRRVYTGLSARLTNLAGYNGVTQRISPSAIPAQVREFLQEREIDPEIAILGGGIGELEAMASQDKSEYLLMPSWADPIAGVLSRYSVEQGSTRVEAVFWPLSDVALRGLLVKVRTALAELVAELIALTPEAQDVPDKAAADQAVHLVVTGHRPTIHVTSQHAPGGTNIVAAEGSPVTMSSGPGTAIGSQTASGDGSSVLGSQAASGWHNTLAGRDGAAADASTRLGWWARLRRRGWVVAVAQIVGAVVGVAALALALGWTPWWR
ncbi:hypothetical protein ACFY36_19395 [Actinoplanes sp. NPDC000266]